MTLADTLRFAMQAANGYRVRTVLLVLAISIGVAAVVTLTALGEGVRGYVVNQFHDLGTNVIFVTPGRTSTGGGMAGSAATSTPRAVTLKDARALAGMPEFELITPIVIGQAEVAANSRSREATIVGTSSEMLEMHNLKMSFGRFLPVEDWGVAGSGAVIGDALRAEFFGSETGIGQKIRLRGDIRLTVIGTLAPTGQGIGGNYDELVFIPVSTALSLFNTDSLIRITVKARDENRIEATRTRIENVMRERRGGKLDITVTSMDAMLATFDNVLGALTLAIGGIAAISLGVAGILVMNVMLVAVTQRTGEVGLLKALGATRSDIIRVFQAEAAILSLIGAVVGYAVGQVGALIIRLYLPMLPAWPPFWAVAASVGLALGSGLIFGVLPARRAAALDPVMALAKH